MQITQNWNEIINTLEEGNVIQNERFKLEKGDKTNRIKSNKYKSKYTYTRLGLAMLLIN